MSQQPEMSQFGKPTGAAGDQVGWLMATANEAINAWTISLLGVSANENVLEIGFGPGVAIQKLVQLSSVNFIAGIDHSEVMLTGKKAYIIGTPH